MPTLDEIKELRKNCTWTWSTLNGVNGYRVTGPNGNSIFLPAAGICPDTWVDYQGDLGIYWSSSLGSSYSCYACGFSFGSSYYDWHNDHRCSGLSVRPVSE
jgi:hypothetical protein